MMQSFLQHGQLRGFARGCLLQKTVRQADLPFSGAENALQEEHMNNRFDLTGKTALITGATRGLGQGMAKALAEAGADIAGVGTSDLSETKEIVEGLGRSFLPIQLDVGEEENREQIIDRTLGRYGTFDILINNAGIIRRSPALEFTHKDWDDVMNINLKAAFFLSQKAAKQFVKKGISGKIINTASMLSYQGGIHVSSYTAAKSGIMGITKLLANEWAKYGINVNAIAPGYMATEMTQAIQEDPKRSGEILSRIPQGRWGTPEDVGGAAVFLASSAADYINGFTIAVDGGFLAR